MASGLFSRLLLTESGLFDKDAIERQLAHQEGNKVRAAYHRSEYLTERSRMMQWWSNYLEELRNRELRYTVILA